mmetsp:Transcript_12211/g.51116  ORF Transcript_12211/g.51116 Transcript_12211/m.51116 type:complete len:289 (+) Transcript_12211:454-1320(+)
MLFASSCVSGTLVSMSPNVATTRSPASFPSNAISGAVNTRHFTISSTGANKTAPSFEAKGLPVSPSTTFKPTVRSTICVSTSKGSPSRPHSTSTFAPFKSPSSTSRSHASPCASMSCPSNTSKGCSSSSTTSPSRASDCDARRRHFSASSRSVKCAAVPSSIVTKSKPSSTSWSSSESGTSARLAAVTASTSNAVMSPETTATLCSHLCSRARCAARASIAGALSSATATQGPCVVTQLTLCHAGPAPSSRRERNLPGPCVSHSDARNAASLSKSRNPNASSYSSGLA